ncbi:MAG: serine/threonine-protein phosphatase [Acidobacteria bacterium]|nr:serine/threonine-protein phosphatase [Acidobacteriota bacterium]
MPSPLRSPRLPADTTTDFEVCVLRACGITDQGRIRPTNEDCFAIDERLNLLVIADGMGGHNAGEVAARLAVDAVVDAVAAGTGQRPFGDDPSLSRVGNLLRTAVLLANARIRAAAVASSACAGMGTTIVAAIACGGRLSVAHVGDSRLYLLGPAGLRQLTADDSWMASELARDPSADPWVLQHHPMRHALTNVVSGRAGTAVHVIEEALSGGELILLTTDGVHGSVDAPRLEQLLREHDALPDLVAEVIRTALTHGSRDNCTAVAGRYQRETV